MSGGYHPHDPAAGYQVISPNRGNTRPATEGERNNRLPQELVNFDPLEELLGHLGQRIETTGL